MKKYNYKIFKGKKLIGSYDADNKTDLYKIMDKKLSSRKFDSFMHDFRMKKIKIERTVIGKVKKIEINVEYNIKFGIITHLNKISDGHGKSFGTMKNFKSYIKKENPDEIHAVIATRDIDSKRYSVIKRKDYESIRELFYDLNDPKKRFEL